MPIDHTPSVPAATQRILIAEDSEDTRISLQEMLQRALLLQVDTAENGKQALQMLESQHYSLLITDLRMPELDGMKLLAQIQEKKLPVTVVVSTGEGGVEDAVGAMRMGAYDFLIKPAEPRRLCALVQRALRERELQDEVLALRQQLAGQYSFSNILTKNQRMLEIFEMIGNLAHATSTVLISGETGTGKELIARAIHRATVSRTGPIVAINCAAIPETLLESELFGHEKGSFTGALAQRLGRFELANGGSIFLDEIGDMPFPVQVKLLRVLQERQIERIGGSKPIPIDVRVIAATHQALPDLIKDGKFREDLYYRLNVIRIELPPLRDRAGDIPLLIAHFCQKYSRANQPPPQVSPEAMAILLRYSWPGNVRQLENAVERACITASDGVIQPANLPPELSATSESKHPLTVDVSRTLPEQLAELTAAFEEQYLRQAMQAANGRVGECAKISGLSRRSITDKIARYHIEKGASADNDSDSV